MILSAITKTWQDRFVVVTSFYLQEDPGLRSDKPSPTSTNIFIINSAEVYHTGELVCVKFSVGDVRGPEECSRLIIHITLHEAFVVYVVGVSFHCDVNPCQTREGKVFTAFRVTFREYQDDGLHAHSWNVYVDDFARGVLLPTQSFQQGRVVVTQRPSDVVLVFDLSHKVLALYDLVLQVEVRKFVFALVLAVLGLQDLLGLWESNPVFEVKHAVRRVRTVVSKDLTEGYFHPAAHVGDCKIQNSVHLGGFVTAVILRDQLSNVLVDETELLSVVSVFVGSPKVFVDLHHALSGILLHLHSLDVHTESVNEESPRLFKNQDLVLLLVNLNNSASVSGMMHSLASVQCGDGHGVDVLGRLFGLDEQCNLLSFSERVFVCQTFSCLLFLWSVLRHTTHTPS